MLETQDPGPLESMGTRDPFCLRKGAKRPMGSEIRRGPSQWDKGQMHFSYIKYDPSWVSMQVTQLQLGGGPLGHCCTLIFL